ncbi:MAG TPA: MFS transporter [Polyangiaceae bacterium]|jgi:MFS family permease|nr:MFS transporter [Polyangiaceae bacterium]
MVPSGQAEAGPASGTRAGGDAPKKGNVLLTVLVAALGYFVDIYDLILFLVVRVKSLRGIGVPANQLLDRGVMLLNMQMLGMLAGGILWGVLGDRRGRLSVLLGSIFLYSTANIANGFVQTVEQYAALRLIAGIGLAGELGAGVTLVSEVMSREKRGWGTTAIAGVGLFGAIVAALVGGSTKWQTAYFIGGGLGFCLLALRAAVYESKMFLGMRAANVTSGNFLMLFATRDRLRRYLAVIFVGAPIWFCLSVLVALSPELSRAMGLAEPPDPGRAVLIFYSGACAGDIASGALSQLLASRKKVLGIFIALTAVAQGTYFAVAGHSLFALYACCAFLGLATGYWAVFVTVAAEHFGTNLRATTTTTAPNFVRGSVVPMTMLFQAMRPKFGDVASAAAVGVGTIVIAIVALSQLDETFGRDLDYFER